jgi:hypothetical protein
MYGIAEGYSPEYHGATGSDSRLLGDDVFVESVLRQAEQRKVSVVPVAKLLAAVCTSYNLTGSEITGGSRLASEARSMSAWIARLHFAMQDYQHIQIRTLRRIPPRLGANSSNRSRRGP